MIKLCHIDDLDDPGSRGFEIPTAHGDFNLFLVRKDNQIFAYKDECPHRGISLEWMTHQYLDTSKQHIICSSHGALFNIKDGFCTSGPCVHKSLQALSIKIEQAQIFLESPINRIL